MDVKELANKGFMLILAKLIEKQTAKPISRSIPQPPFY
jgi:hypothetical protein